MTRERHAQEQAAAKLLAAVKGGQSLADAATVAGVTVRRTPLVTRDGDVEGMPPQLAQVLFGLKKGEPTMVETADGFIVAVPAEIVDADPNADKADPGRLWHRRHGIADALRARASRRRSSAGQRLRQTCMLAERGAAAGASIQPGLAATASMHRVNLSERHERLRPTRLAAFRAAYEAGRGTLVWRRGVADLETPVAAFLKLAHGRPNSFLLESVEGGAARGRYSIIGMEPDLVWRCRDGRAEVNRHALSAPHAFVADARPALESLRALIDETRLDVPAQPAADGGRTGRLSRLRHGPADGDAAGEEAGCARRAGGAADPADPVRDLRQRERRADLGGAGLSARRGLRRRSVGDRAGTPR